jgi:hypothetical protein
MQTQRYQLFFIASALALTVGCASQGTSEAEAELTEEGVCSTKSSDCPVICVKSGFGHCEEPVDPCLKHDGGCEPKEPCDDKHGDCEPKDPCEKYPEECEPKGCTLTQGYWKNHPDAWPKDGISIGETTYYKSTLIALLNTPPAGGNAVLILLHQYIAAYLNVASGADSSAIDEVAAEALEWLETYFELDANGDPSFVHASTPEGEKAIELAAILDAFNNGYIGPGHCDDE